MYSLRVANCIKGFAKVKMTSNVSQSMLSPLNRTFVYSSRFNIDHLTKSKKHPDGCACCSLVSKAFVHMSADKDLAQFLDKEIVLEKNMSKVPKIGSRIPGFDTVEDGANVSFSRKLQDEEITVKLNVNGSVDPDESQMPEDYNPQENEPPHLGEMKSKPDFTVEIKKANGRTLVVSCSFYRGPPDEMESEEQVAAAEKGDVFQIDNFYLLNKSDYIDGGDIKDNIYMGDGEIIDGEMYDLLMNYLDERGISNEFADNLIEFCTHYEHRQYIDLLSKLKSFVSE